MRIWASGIISSLLLVAVSANAAPITAPSFVLDSNVGYGAATALPPSIFSCFQPNCVLFSGTLSYGGSDPLDLNPLYLIDIGVEWSSEISDLSIDNTFFVAPPAQLSGDVDSGTDGSGAAPYSYSGPIFGIDIAPDTPLGSYEGTVTIYAMGGLTDPDYQGFTLTQNITVDVVAPAPEPGANQLLMAGLFSFAIWYGVKRKWRFFEVSR